MARTDGNPWVAVFAPWRTVTQAGSGAGSMRVCVIGPRAVGRDRRTGCSAIPDDTLRSLESSGVLDRQLPKKEGFPTTQSPNSGTIEVLGSR